MDGRVVIVGAGPVGCTAALALARRGIPVLLLDREAHVPCDVRASTIHPSSLDLLETIGVTERIVPQGLDVPVLQFRDRRSDEYVDFDLGMLGDETRFPMQLQCEQANIARVIVAMLTELPHAEVRLGVEVGDVLPDAGGVTLTVRDRNGRIDLVRGAYALACDGASSTIRKRLGIAFEGFTYPEKFLSVAVSLDCATVVPGLANVSYFSDPEHWCALLRVVGSWRAVFPADPAAGDDALLADAFVDRQLRSVVPAREPLDIVHRSVYRVHQRVATSFHHGRVLLAGDAAHLNSPLGGMGMNSGLHDAFNAVEKIARIIIGGEDPEPLLAQYTRQRRMIAIEYVQAANARRHEHFDDVRAIAGDPVRAREYLRRSTLYESLERANAVA